MRGFWEGRLKNVLEGVLGSIMRSYFRVYSYRDWMTAIQSNNQYTLFCTFDCVMKFIWQLGFKLVVCSVIYSI